MEEESKSSGVRSSNSNNPNITMDTSKSERSVWLMKCPVVVANSWKTAADNQPVSKVVVSLDPLRPEDPSSLQVPIHYNLLLLIICPNSIYLLLLLLLYLSFIVLWLTYQIVNLPMPGSTFFIISKIPSLFTYLLIAANCLIC